VTEARTPDAAKGSPGADLLQRGIDRESRGDYAGAIADYQAAMADSETTTSVEAAYRLGRLYEERLGSPGRAVDAYRAVPFDLQNGSDHWWDAGLRLAHALMPLGQMGPVIDAYQEVIEKGDERAVGPAALELGALHQDRMNNQDAALSAYRIATDRGDPPIRAMATVRMGQIFAAQGRSEQAERAFRSALDSGDPGAADLARAGLQSMGLTDVSDDPAQTISEAATTEEPLPEAAMPPPEGPEETPPRPVGMIGFPDDPSLFVDRAEALEQVKRSLGDAASGRPRVLVVSGPPGSGTTSLVVRAAWALQDRFDTSVFVGGVRHGAPIVFEVLRLLRADVAPDTPPADLIERYRSVISDPRVLVVVDGHLPEDQLDALIPPPGGGALLSADTQPSERSDLENVVLDPLDARAAAELVRLLQPELAPDQVEAVVEKGEGLPGTIYYLASETAPPRPTAARRPVRARYASDDVPRTGPVTDHLRVRQEAEALAWVISADDVEPPLSIGLFGDWGSGKTTFMHLLEEEIHRISSDAKRAHAAGEDYPFCESVRHVWFNAWHYVDANLWASLVSHLFEQLAEPTEEFRNLVGKLKTTEALTQHAEERKSQGRERREKAEAELTTVRTEKEQLTRQVEQGNINLTTLPSDQLIKDKAQQVKDLLSEDARTREPVALARELTQLGPRLRYVFKLVKAQPRWLKLTALSGVLIALALMGISFAFPELTSKALGWITGAVTFIGAIAAAVREPVARVSAAVRQTTEVIQSAARSEIANKEQREAELQTEASEARQQEEEAERELIDIREGRRVYRYLEDRLRSDDYRRQLGIIALIRRDFEELTKAMDSDRQARRAVRAARRKGQPEPMESAEKLPEIDRIILYIDDLDRCPAERVVEVLEAVHLLLAFRLFVVVVGVDSKWLFTSLERHYWAQLGSDGPPRSKSQERMIEREEAYWASTPQNYLEKIFQIPFALRRMRPAGFETLVTELLKPPPGLEGTPPPLTEAETALKAHADMPLPAPPPQPAIDSTHAEAPTPAVLSPAEAAPSSAVEATVAQQAAPTRAATPAASEPPRPPPDALFVSDEELSFLSSDRMAGLVPTPRAAKRFANTYRLLRATLGDKAMERFLPRPDGREEFRVLAVLLGIVVGFPNQVNEVFLNLFESEEATWWGFVDQLFPDRVLLEETGDEEEGGPDGAGQNEEDELREDDSMARLETALMAFRHDRSMPDQLEAYRFWAGPAARYSFQVGRLADLVAGADEDGHS
jgi:tetratricopeptide (TPR) repeat protein